MSEGRARKITLPLTLGVLVLGGLAIVTALRDDTPPLTRESYESARARWERRAVADYTVEVLKELDRQASERVRTVVRGGRATSLTINDRSVPTSASYAIDGLFDMIERELEMADSGERQPGQPSEVTLRARFDEDSGVPLVFKRLAANSKSVIVTVTSFEVAGH